MAKWDVNQEEMHPIRSFSARSSTSSSKNVTPTQMMSDRESSASRDYCAVKQTIRNRGIMFFIAIIIAIILNPDKHIGVFLIRIGFTVVFIFILLKFSVMRYQMYFFESFAISFVVIAVTYFFITCPLKNFLFITGGCAILAVISFLLKYK